MAISKCLRCGRFIGKNKHTCPPKIGIEGLEVLREFKRKKNKTSFTSKKMKELWNSPSYKKKISRARKLLWKKQEYRNKQKEILIKRWSDPIWKEKQIKLMMKAHLRRPTGVETKFIDFFKKYGLPYKYTGDGSFLIGYKNPDFVNVNGKKTCIEVSNKEFRRVFYGNLDSHVKQRINHFSRYGWTCAWFWENDLKNETILLQKINDIGVKNG